MKGAVERTSYIVMVIGIIKISEITETKIRLTCGIQQEKKWAASLEV